MPCSCIILAGRVIPLPSIGLLNSRSHQPSMANDRGYLEEDKADWLSGILNLELPVRGDDMLQHFVAGPTCNIVITNSLRVVIKNII